MTREEKYKMIEEMGRDWELNRSVCAAKFPELLKMAKDSLNEKCLLPKWDTCKGKVDIGEASPLELFIYENEPAGEKEAKKWRLSLSRAIPGVEEKR